MDKAQDKTITHNPDTDNRHPTVTTRRDFVKKAGAVAFYTPPALAALMQPSREAIASGGKPGRRFGQRNPKPGNGYGRDRNR